MKYEFSVSSNFVCDTIVERIHSLIKNDIPVLFLASGGSTAGIAVDVCRTLQQLFSGKPENLKSRFTLSLIDERFGPVGHKDSNWKLLIDRGLKNKDFTCFPILGDSNSGSGTLENAVRHFNSFLADAVQKKTSENLFIAGLFGIGMDGHTAGILPFSPVSMSDISSDRYAEDYTSPPFTRITITPSFFPFIDFAVAYAKGKEKIAALELLRNFVPPKVQSAQLLKLAKETIIFASHKVKQ